MPKTRLSLFLLVLLAGCSANKNPFSQNRYLDYRFPQPGPPMELQYWAISSDSVAIRLRFLNADLGLMPDADDLEPKRRLLIRASFYPEFKRRKPILSQPLVLESGLSDTAIFTGAELHLPMLTGTEGLLELDIRDLQKKNSRFKYLNLSRLKQGNALDFQVFEKGNPSIHSWVRVGNPSNIRYVDKQEQRFILEHYLAEFPLPAPPFAVSSELKPFPDAYLKESISRDELLDFRFEKQEFLRICSEYYPNTGLGLLVAGSNFPGLSNDVELFRSLVYLMQKEEIKQFSGISDFHLWKFLGLDKAHSEAVEKLWMERIRHANLLFTSYVPGWRTDRGMIYTIFGPPSSVYNNGRAEEWNYNPKSGSTPINFRFERISQAYYQDEYRLERRATYATVWYKAVESWRNGNALSYE
jgi:GWxTD domain-containing protein